MRLNADTFDFADNQSRLDDVNQTIQVAQALFVSTLAFVEFISVVPNFCKDLLKELVCHLVYVFVLVKTVIPFHCLNNSCFNFFFSLSLVFRDLILSATTTSAFLGIHALHEPAAFLFDILCPLVMFDPGICALLHNLQVNVDKVGNGLANNIFALVLSLDIHGNLPNSLQISEASIASFIVINKQ